VKWGKRLALSVGALGTVAALVGAASFALFTSAATSQTDTFAAGTVILGGSNTSTCNITNMEPGDSSSGASAGNKADSPCEYTISYSGSLAAWIGLQIGVNSTAGSTYAIPPGSATPMGGEALINPAGSNGLQVMLQDSASGTTFSLPTLTCTPNVNASNIATGDKEVCSGTSGFLLVPGGMMSSKGCTVTATVNADCSVNNGWQDTFTLNYYLPESAGNGYQGSSAIVTLTARAVQESNNPLVNGQPELGWHQTPTMVS
jgi:hypothetical protein